MKNLKLIILFLICLMIYCPNVKAAGICAGDGKSTGYCTLAKKVNVCKSTYSPSRLEYAVRGGGYESIVGDPAPKNKYTGNYDGKPQDMFCLDPNLAGPECEDYDQGYLIDISKGGFDLAIAKAYTLYMLENPSNPTVNLQMVNMAMRAIAIEKGFSTAKEGAAFASYLGFYQNINQQLKGSPPASGVILNETKDPSAYALVKKFYKGNVEVKKYDVKIEKDASAEIKAEDSGGQFKRTVTLNVTGIENFTKGSFSANDVYVRIEKDGVSCPGFDNVKCELVGEAGKNLLEGADLSKGVQIQVAVSGNIEDFKENTPIKVKIKYEYNHPLDAKNLIILRKSDNLLLQRMIMLVPKEPLDAETEVPINAPTKCGICEGTGASMKCYVEGKAVSVKEYMDAGCCAGLKDSYKDLSEDNKKIYDACCDESGGGGGGGGTCEFIYDLKNKDRIELNNDCRNDGESGGYSHSLIKQLPIDTLLDIITGSSTKSEEVTLEDGTSLVCPDAGTPPTNSGYEKTLADSPCKYSDSAVEKYIKNLIDNEEWNKYYQDLKYLESAAGGQIAATNKFCRLYTSETADIWLPGTNEATSGRYFVHEKQPYIKSAIDAAFHTNVDFWLNKYKAAIDDEHKAYTEWQAEKALESAIKNAKNAPNPTASKGSCAEYGSETCSPSGCSKGEEGCSCSTPCVKWNWEGSVSKKTDQNKFYNANGSAINNTEATKKCSKVASSRPTFSDSDCTTSPSSANVSGKEGAYKGFVKTRQDLQAQKEACETKSNIGQHWTYYSEPDLTFSYEQWYYDPSGLNSKPISETQNFSLIPAYTPPTADVKVHWPNPTTTQTPSWQLAKNMTGTKNLTQISGTSNSGGDTKNRANYYGQYGGGTDKGNIEMLKYDANPTYKSHYEHTIYYRPIEKYYSLMPEGMYKKETELTGQENALEVGYVYNVKLTNYTGEYRTWFTVENIGHLKGDFTTFPTAKDATDATALAAVRAEKKKLISNIQARLDECYKDATKCKKDATEVAQLESATGQPVNTDAFINRCYYKSKEIAYDRDCPTCCLAGDPGFPNCLPPTSGSYSENWFTRPTADDALNPTGRKLGENWDDSKGEAAKKAIEAAGDAIYNDATNPNSKTSALEYSINLTSEMMRYVKNLDETYNTWNDSEWKCNSSGKECESKFLDNLKAAYNNNVDILGRNKFKYFDGAKFVVGKMSDFTSLFPSGKYPNECHRDRKNNKIDNCP